jgi:hypothetical protein
MKHHHRDDSIYNKALRDNNQNPDIVKELNNYLTVSSSERKAKIDLITLEKPVTDMTHPLKQNLTDSRIINYLPERQANFTPSNLLSYPIKNKAFNAIKINKKIGKSSTTSDTDILTFQTSHMLKFAKSAENYHKMHNYIENQGDGVKKLSLDSYVKLKSINDRRDKIVFDHFSVDEGNYSLYREIVFLLYDYEQTWQKLLDISLRENKRLRDDNIGVLKRYNDLEGLNESNKKEISYLKEYIGDNDVTYKNILRKKKLNEADILKDEFDRRGKLNMIKQHQLEEE